MAPSGTCSKAATRWINRKQQGTPDGRMSRRISMRKQYGALLAESSVLLMMAHFHSEQIRSVYADGFSMGRPAIRQAWL